MEPMVGDVTDNVTVLWSSKNEEFAPFEVIQPSGEDCKSVPHLKDPSLGGSPIDQSGDTDPIHVFKEEVGDISQETHLEDAQHGTEDSTTILNSDDMAEGHMLLVPENDGNVLCAPPSNIQVTTTLSSDLTRNTDTDVIQLFLPADENSGNGENHLQPINISLGNASLTTNSVMSPSTQTVQAITLSDGTTAFIQHPMSSVNIVSSLQEPGVGQLKTEVNDSTVKLDDTAVSLNQALKDGLQAILLEDGTTAYLATQQTPQFMENATLEATTLTLDQLTSPATNLHTLPNSNLHTLPNSMMNLDVKTLTIPQNGLTNGTDPQQPAKTIVTSSPSSEKAPFVEKAYKCSYEGCGRYYTTLHHLRVHERSHTGDRPFRCEFAACGKAFATGYGLKSHTRVHTGEKPYKCPEETCDKAFKTSGDLQKHVRTHTGERPFKCPFEGCTRSFTTSNIRKVHIRTHTGERPYTCPEEGCGRAFASATNYKNHIRIHTGEKPYVCTVQGCGKRFTEYSSLYKHHVVHTHAKPYTCNRCGKTYRQTSTLAMHKRTTHGEDVTAESEAILFHEQSQVEGFDPPEKRARLDFSLSHDDLQDEGEGTLIINTSDTGQQLTFVSPDSLNVGTSENVQVLPQQSAILQQAGVATFTLGDQGQQVYVITDPAQLEALQQIAQHQFDADSLDSSLITVLPSSDVSTLEAADTESTLVTEITAAHDIIDQSLPINIETSVANIHTFSTDS